MFCLPKNIASTFLDKLKIGEISPEMLVKLSSQERRAYFSEFMGDENAKQVNTLLESKLILKDQQKGIINWAKQISGLKPAVVNDIITRVNKMDQILTPENETSFLSDLAESKLGVSVTMEEAATISELARLTSQAKQRMNNGTGDRMSYGRARVAFSNYVNDLKQEANKKTPLQYAKDPIKFLSEAAGNAKAIKASLDNSALLRQGWKALWTHPKEWLKNATASFGYIVRTLGNQKVYDEISADIVSRPNYPLMQAANLATGTIEESYPTALPEKIPILGRLYKASEVAFTGFVHKLRADIFDSYIDVAKKSGVNLNDPKELIGLGRLVNSLTGRGDLRGLEPAADAVNNIFFSPRFLKSNIDVLTMHSTDPNFSAFARKQAAINLLKIVSGTAAILTVANAVSPESVEWDPRSADFGNIKSGKTRFNVTGGMASIVTLASRLATHSSKSSTSNRVYQLDSGKYGSQTGTDVVYNFFENKLSPAASVVKDLIKGRDFNKKRITVGGEVNNLITPLIISNYLELKNNPDSADILTAMIADALGISVNTY